MRNHGPLRSSNGSDLDAKSVGGGGCCPGPRLVGPMFSIAMCRFDDGSNLTRAKNVDGPSAIQPVAGVQQEEKLSPAVSAGRLEERKNFFEAFDGLPGLIELNPRK